jgi:hypothetical protein
MLAPGHDIQNGACADSQAGFLEAFPLCSSAWILVTINKTRRQGPEPAKGFVEAPDEKDATIGANESRGGNLWIDKVNPSAVWA